MRHDSRVASKNLGYCHVKVLAFSFLLFQYLVLAS